MQFDALGQDRKANINQLEEEDDDDEDQDWSPLDPNGPWSTAFYAVLKGMSKGKRKGEGKRKRKRKR